MARRWVRIAVVIVALVVLSFLGNRIRIAENTLDHAQNAERVFTDLTWTLSLTLGELQAAAQAYVAAGQDRGYWTSRVESLVETVRDSLDNLRRLAAHPTSVEALDSAAGAMAEFEQLDARAREHTDLQQPLLASDLIFTDGLELTTRVATHVELARATERTTRTETIRQARATQTRLLLGGVAVGVLAMLLLVPGRRHTDAAPAAESGESAAPADPPALSGEDRLLLDGLDLAADRPRDDPDRRRSALTAGGAAGPAGAEAMPDLRAAADLCTDLGRLASPSDLTGLLARATDLMNASGLIVWVHDAGSGTLRPAVGHGYPQQVLAAMGAIPDDGDNATAAAYRAGRMQVVDSRDDGCGALAAPLLSSDRCVGVLSAELHDRWEASASVQATVAIVAAQLATLIPAPASADSDALEPPAAKAHG